MSVLSVRNLPPETHRALKLRAAQNGRSTEAEVRAILVEAVKTEHPVGIGTQLANFAASYGGLDLNIVRDAEPVMPADFG